MSIHLHWFLPTAGDSRSVAGWGATEAQRTADLAYLTQVAQAADRLGFDAVLTPTGTFCEDAWITTASLLSATERLRFLVAFRPGLISPTLAAQQAATFQRMSGGRLLLNVVTGASEVEQRRFGDHLNKDERYARCDEFLEVLRGCWNEGGLDFEGDHFHVDNAMVADPTLPRPPIFFGGSSDAALRVAARQSDVWLMWGEPLEAAAEELGRVKALAQAEGRTLEYGIRFHTIARDRAEDAWAQTDRIIDSLSPETIAESQKVIAVQSASVGQARMNALHGGSVDNLVVAPNLWAGFGLVRGGAGTALVGSHEEVAERIREYHAIGFTHFILSGQPHLEEAYHFGEGVTPLLRRDGLLAPLPMPALTGIPQWA
ncbi:MAG: LLM class flavin-dependent oxidoreductase [Microthrixaceae bacterium]|nr:LLM class flavin-dependent oxidoreductase [Microthrixaceae bacterium]